MDVSSPEERHDSSDGSGTKATEGAIQSSDKPTVILVIGDCATRMIYG